jgi:chromosome segregation ATPase
MSHNTSKHSLKDSKLGADSIDSQLLKDNLSEFFKNSKEKLTRLKNEIEDLENENQRQTHENKMLQIRNNELIQYNEELNLRIKGMKEKMLIAQKNKAKLQGQTRDLRKDIDSISKDIDSMKINNQFKVKLIQNDIDHVNVIKENNIKALRNKIQVEQNYQDSLIKKMNEIKDEIAHYKELIKSTTSEDNSRNKQIVKETNEMTKFLTNL